jgi:hypothetical protein
LTDTEAEGIDLKALLKPDDARLLIEFDGDEEAARSPKFGFREMIVPSVCVAVCRKLTVRMLKKEPTKSIAIPIESHTRNA